MCRVTGDLIISIIQVEVERGTSIPDVHRYLQFIAIPGAPPQILSDLSDRPFRRLDKWRTQYHALPPSSGARQLSGLRYCRLQSEEGKKRREENKTASLSPSGKIFQ